MSLEKKYNSLKRKYQELLLASADLHSEVRALKKQKTLLKKQKEFLLDRLITIEAPKAPITPGTPAPRNTQIPAAPGSTTKSTQFSAQVASTSRARKTPTGKTNQTLSETRDDEQISPYKTQFFREQVPNLPPAASATGHMNPYLTRPGAIPNTDLLKKVQSPLSSLPPLGQMTPELMYPSFPFMGGPPRGDFAPLRGALPGQMGFPSQPPARQPPAFSRPHDAR